MDFTQFNEKYPNIPAHELNSFSESIAKECMNSIVEAMEQTGNGENAWQEIGEIFNVVLEAEHTTLRKYIVPSKEIQYDFNMACIDENIEGIKNGLMYFCKIKYDISSDPSGFIKDGDSVLTDMAAMDNINTIKFFIEDDFINHNPIYKNQVNFEAIKSYLFEIAYEFESENTLKYLILEHNVEFDPKAKHLLKNGEHTELNKELLNLISNKHLNYSLSYDLENNNRNKSKPKI